MKIQETDDAMNEAKIKSSCQMHLIVFSAPLPIRNPSPRHKQQIENYASINKCVWGSGHIGVEVGGRGLRGGLNWGL